MTASMARTDCEVAVIGAGPYGLAVASALKASGVETLTIGGAMSFWRDHMPKGMRLRSPWHATYIGHTNGPLSLDSYAEGLGISPEQPLMLEDFVRYGLWMQAQAVPDLDPRMVGRVETADGGFRIAFADGDTVRARRVVIATGLMNQQLVPAAFKGLPGELVSHASEHTGYKAFRGKRVAVIGRGQSACETAVLAKQSGADVELVCRGDIHWLGHRALSGKQAWSLRDFLSERLASPSRVGPFPISWLVEVPGVVHHFPEMARAGLNRRSLGAGATGWLRPGFDGIRVNAGSRIVSAAARDHGIELRFEKGSAVYDHVLLGTGYEIDIARLGLFSQDMLATIARRGGMPILSAGLESSIPGLHFVGASAVGSYGPLMRFTAGTPFAARTVSRFVRKARGRR